MMLDLLITNAALPDGRTGMAVAVHDGRITEVTQGLQAQAVSGEDALGLAGERGPYEGPCC